MRVALVLGHNGMLGHVVARVFREAGLRVLTTDRRFLGEGTGFLEELRAAKSDVIVNCVGVTRSSADEADVLSVNGLLPQLLALGRVAPKTILASSDGVFSGRRGNYAVTDPPDADDCYGLSKRLGELAAQAPGVYVLRTSIVGPDRSAPRNLLSWFLERRERVNGYVDQRWNGITTLAWARLALRIAEGDGSVAPGLQQPACESPLTKAELLCCFRRVYEKGPEVEALPSGRALDRTLVPTIPMPSIEEQLRDLRDWYEP